MEFAAAVIREWDKKSILVGPTHVATCGN